jgi:hypothetical protein
MLDLPTLLYVLEPWTIKAKTSSRILAAEMKFMTKV